MWNSNQSPSQCVQLPDPSVVRAGKVPARWYKNVEQKESDVNVPPNNYVFCLPQSVPETPFEFVPSPTISSHTSGRHADNQVVECELCQRRCRIAPGKAGRCSARVNDGGILRARFYGRPVSANIDPIEKKPLYHFLPGSTILSLGTQGCNLSCKFCQNWHISRPLPVDSTVNQILDPRQVVEIAVKNQTPSVAFTYNEPTIWAEYVVDVARLCRQQGIKTVAVTNGMIDGKGREDFYREIDAANVDLKAFTASFYQKLAGGDLEQVKSTLKYVVKKTNVWLEITNLLIPGFNDSESETRAMCDWIVNELDANIPLHFSAFFPAWRLTDVPRTPPEKLVAAAQIARESGLRYVYLGNVQNDEGQTTRCPECGTVLIQRSGYQTQTSPLLTADVAPGHSNSSGKCGRCGANIPGIFRAEEKPDVPTLP